MCARVFWLTQSRKDEDKTRIQNACHRPFLFFSPKNRNGMGVRISIVLLFFGIITFTPEVSSLLGGEQDAPGQLKPFRGTDLIPSCRALS